MVLTICRCVTYSLPRAQQYVHDRERIMCRVWDYDYATYLSVSRIYMHMDSLRKRRESYKTLSNSVNEQRQRGV